ncbi:MAG: hypothetical protein AAGI54_10535 [Planctomycetota bacterium]
MRTWTLALTAAAALSVAAASEAWAEEAVERVDGWIAVPAEAQPILPLKDVHPGMTGYGRTIFRGTTIETFPVEVATVLPGQSPGTSTIWIRSSDPRLEESSGAQGMSGSPIYLWPEDLPEEQRVLGENGLLIGAFAFVYSDTYGMLSGVQPIEYMRGVGDRMASDGEARTAGVGAGGRGAATMIDRLGAQLAAMGLPSNGRLDAVARLTETWSGRAAGASNRVTSLADGSDRPSATTGPTPLGVAVPLGDAAGLLAPLLEGTGLQATSGGMSSSLLSSPPRDVDAAVKLEPGSVLSVPLSFGDLTLAGHGTVTDVLPDGRVLGFGHSMMGMGPISLPVATGYVHFVVPRSVISFRLATPMQTAGTMLRDENAAVTATDEIAFATSPMTVTSSMPGQGESTYDYEVVHHPTLTPVIVAVLGIQSMNARQQPPLDSTLYLEGELRFAGDRTIPLKVVAPDASAGGVASAVIPFAAPMLDNPFEKLVFEGADLSLRVEPTLKSASLLGARLDRAVAAPGQTVTLTAELIAADGQRRTISQPVVVPEDTGDGEAEIMIGGLNAFLFRDQMMSPHRYVATDIDELTRVLQDMAAMPDDALYVSTVWPQRESLAVGRTALPRLPSSRLAMLSAASHSDAMPYPETTTHRVAMDDVPQGELRLMLTVRDPTGDSN